MAPIAYGLHGYAEKLKTQKSSLRIKKPKAFGLIIYFIDAWENRTDFRVLSICLLLSGFRLLGVVAVIESSSLLLVSFAGTVVGNFIVELFLDFSSMLDLSLTDPCCSAGLQTYQLEACQKNMVLLRIASISNIFLSIGISLIVGAQLYKLYLHYEKESE